MPNRSHVLGFLVLVVISAGTGLCVREADAALPPPYDRLRQFAAVADAAEVAEALAEHGLIDRIERLEDGSFQVWAGTCFVAVTLEAIPPKQGMVGPTSYEARPGAVTCE